MVLSFKYETIFSELLHSTIYLSFYTEKLKNEVWNIFCEFLP